MVPQRYRQTDGRTGGRLTIAIPRFALRASRGKKEDQVQKYYQNLTFLLHFQCHIIRYQLTVFGHCMVPCLAVLE